MKVDNLLGPYLYQHKTLFLPGIGLFLLDDNAILPDESSKLKSTIAGISFREKPGAALDDALIQYIKDQTGKMKALAEADLYSYIASAFQFLNIGKPFYFEGIGSLQKNKDGFYTFLPGTVITQKSEEPHSRQNDNSLKNTYNNNGSPASSGNLSGRILVAVGIVITLALVVAGGYYLYHKNTVVEPEAVPAAAALTDSMASPIVVPRDSAFTAKQDSSAKAAPVLLRDSSMVTGYRFILESTPKKSRALSRYDKVKDVPVLKPYNNTIKLDSSDTAAYKLFTVVSCTAADTARVKAQLNAWYYGTKEMKVKLDH